MSALQGNLPRFAELDAHVLGVSVDSTATKAAWAKSLGGIDFDLLSDFYPHGEVASLYGVLHPDGIAERAIFVVDKAGVILFAQVYLIPSEPDLAPVFEALAGAST